MDRLALEYLCCPDCHGEFTLVAPDDDKIIVSGELRCPKCSESYKIINGIPVILKGYGAMETTQRAFGTQWRLHATGHFEKDRIFGRTEETCRNNLTRFFGLKPEDDCAGKVFLDAGCGLAQYARTFAKTYPQALAFAVDISDSVFHIRDVPDNVVVVKCDLHKPPFRPGIFDFIWSYGVLHHTPSTERIFRAVAGLATVGGQFYLWVYSRHKTKYSFIARSILRRSYRFPWWLNYGLAHVMAVPVWLVYKAFLWSSPAAKKPLIKRHPFRNIVIGIYDSLVPEYQHYHTRDEVIGWFRSSSFDDMKLVGDIGVVGTKA